MKRITLLIAMLTAAAVLLAGCSKPQEVPESFDSAESVTDFMLEENAKYADSGENDGNIAQAARTDTAENGQAPYAVVVTCSDSRVPAEHIFSAGIGELFVIRTAGNVIGDYELGSVEYGADHLHTKLVVVLGHTNCGAVDAALNGGAHGYFETITDEINSCLPEGCDARKAEILNVRNSISKIRSSEIMQELEANGEVAIKGAIYDIETGEVEFLD